MVVPDGGKCFGCETDMSGKVAKYVCRNEEFSLFGYDAAVFSWAEDNVSCASRTCMNKNMDNWQEKTTRAAMADKEASKFLKYAKFCDQCLKFSLNSHRCYACLSAQYCSEECRVKDLDWHRTVCETWAEDETRKMPRGKKQLKKIDENQKKIEKMLMCSRPGCDQLGDQRCKRCDEVKSLELFYFYNSSLWRHI